MITIGIEGKPGSGKTTLCKHIKDNLSVVHIEVDPLIEKLHLLPFRNFGFRFANRVVRRTFAGKGKYKYLNIKSDPDNIKIPTSKIFLMMTHFYYWVLGRAIKKMLIEYENNGTDVVLVDYALLNVAPIWHEFDHRICVIKNEESRVKAVESRDCVDKKGVEFISLFSYFDVVKYGEGDVHCIYNNDTVENLIDQGNILLEKIKKDL